jgi:hypothetical protein
MDKKGAHGIHGEKGSIWKGTAEEGFLINSHWTTRLNNEGQKRNINVCPKIMQFLPMGIRCVLSGYKLQTQNSLSKSPIAFLFVLTLATNYILYYVEKSCVFSGGFFSTCTPFIHLL